MKKPNFKGWIKRELKRVEQDKKDYKIDTAWWRTARIAKELAKRYSLNHSYKKAAEQYSLASDAYAQAGYTHKAYDMHKKAEEIRNNNGKDISKIVKNSGIITSIILIIIGAYFSTSNITGFSIIQLRNVGVQINLLGIILVLLGILILLFISKKRNI